MSILDHGEESNEERSMGSRMFGPKMGTWTVHSDSDPKWNKSGRAVGLVCLDGPDDMHAWIKECHEKFGKCPADCTYSFFKD